jgi:hypothetical protein
MIQLNVVPNDSNGQPVPNPLLTCMGYDARGYPLPIEPQIRPQTNVYNGDGPYAPADLNGHLYVGPFTMYGTVEAQGFQKTYYTAEWDGKATLNIPVTMPSSFSAPARDRVIAVQASFQGLTMPSPAGLIPGFGPFGWSRDLNAAGRSAWRAVERGAGDTHAIRAISAEYKNDAGYSYPISGCDFTQDLVGLKSMIAEEVQSGATAVNLYLAGDGQAYTPDGGCYGWPWIMANQARIVAALRDKTILGFDATRRIIFFHGFELISNGGWSPSNFEQAILALRALGDDLYIGSHIGVYTWWGDAVGAGGPVSDWSGPAGQAIDVCVEEGDAPFVDANTGAPLNNSNCDGWQQRAVAHLPNPNMAIIAPKNVIMREWVTNPLTPRGPRTSIALETDEARWVRGQVTLQEIQFERVYQRQLGWSYVG